jgi:aspartate/methionine/tyrosine aminotransferase
MELAERLIREHGVAVIPGNAFGLANGCHLRVAYAAQPTSVIREGCERLVSGLKAVLGD